MRKNKIKILGSITADLYAKAVAFNHLDREGRLLINFRVFEDEEHSEDTDRAPLEGHSFTLEIKGVLLERWLRKSADPHAATDNLIDWLQDKVRKDKETGRLKFKLPKKLEGCLGDFPDAQGFVNFFEGSTADESEEFLARKNNTKLEIENE